MKLAKQKVVVNLRADEDFTISTSSSIMGIWLKDLVVKDYKGSMISNAIVFLKNRLKNNNFREEVLLEYGEVSDSINRTWVKNLRIKFLS